MSGTDPGPDLCIAMCGDYKCEGLKGHDGPHFALRGDIEWLGEYVPRSPIDTNLEGSE